MASFVPLPSGTVVARRAVADLGGYDTSHRFLPDLEFFPRIMARWPFVVVEDPAIVYMRTHHRCYRFVTWLEPTFLAKLEAVERRAAAYSSEDPDLKRVLFRSRMRGHYRYMLDCVLGKPDTGFRRRVARRLCRPGYLSWRLRLAAFLAAALAVDVRALSRSLLTGRTHGTRRPGNR